MNKLTKIVSSGALAAVMATAGLGAAPASARDNGAGLAIGLGVGLLVGGILLNQHRHHIYSQDSFYSPDYAPATCYYGPLQAHWIQQCVPGGYCRTVQQVYRQQYCN